jgi:hypothetical protein
VALLAVAFPIVPGKTEAWKEFIGELNGARCAQFEESRRQMGVRERTFLQPTPMGDMVIVTLEGDDPMGAFGKFVSGTDEFTNWFMSKTKELHGIDLRAPMPAVPMQVIDSQAIPQHA